MVKLSNHVQLKHGTRAAFPIALTQDTVGAKWLSHSWHVSRSLQTEVKLKVQPEVLLLCRPLDRLPIGVNQGKNNCPAARHLSWLASAMPACVLALVMLHWLCQHKLSLLSGEARKHGSTVTQCQLSSDECRPSCSRWTIDMFMVSPADREAQAFWLELPPKGVVFAFCFFIF